MHFIYDSVTDYFIAMYTVGDSGSITCRLTGVLIQNHTWYDEEGNTVGNGNELGYSANDSIHHKLYSCYGLSSTISEIEAIYLKFIINSKPET